MGAQDEMKALESDKASESKEGSDKPKLDAIKTLSERVELSRADETYTKVKVFSVGDGGFGIDGLSATRDERRTALSGGVEGGRLPQSGAQESVKGANAAEVAGDAKATGDGGKTSERPPFAAGNEGPIFAAKVKRNDLDQIFEIEIDNGKKNKIEYGVDGRISKVEIQGDSTIEREDDHWVIVDAQGTRTQWKGQVVVTAEGDIALVHDGGVGKVYCSDGTRTELSASDKKAAVDQQIEIEQQRLLIEKAMAENAALAIQKAIVDDEEEDVYKVLRELNDHERKLLIDIYKEKFNIDLIEQLPDCLDSGPELDRAKYLLERKDADFKVKRVNAVAMEKAADAIYKALDGSNDTETVYEILKGRSEAERKMIDAFYRIKYGWKLEDEFKDNLGEGSAYARAVNLLHRKDGKADDAGRIREALLEQAEMGGRSQAMCEKDIRDTIASMSSRQIAQLDEEYQRRYGQSLAAALANEDLSEQTRQSLEIYLKGTDVRTPEDTSRLVDIALNAEDVLMFQEALGGTSQDVRDQLLREPDLQQRLDDAFSSGDLAIANEYLAHGELSTAGKIAQCGGLVDDSETGIEKALYDMKTEERLAYRRGKSLTHRRESTLSESEKHDLKTYRDIRAQIECWGDKDEIARWEDMALDKGGTLVTKLGEFDKFDDDESAVFRTIEDMSLREWLRLKNDDEYLDQIRVRLKDFLDGDDLERAMNLLNQKRLAKTFPETQEIRRSILDNLSKDVATDANNFGHDVPEEDVYHAIANMTTEERRRYREEPDFKKQLDEAVSTLLVDRDGEVAATMLENIGRGDPPEGKPPGQIITKLYIHAAKGNTDEAQVVRDLQKAFRESEENGDKPTLRERITNPQNAEDVELQLRFSTALNKALDPDEIEKLVKPLLEPPHHLPIEVQMKLNEGTIDDDELGAYKDIVNATPEERARILNDKSYREEVMGFLGSDDQEIALTILKQSALVPDDIANASPKKRLEALDRVVTDAEYRDKLLGHLSDEEKLLALRVLRYGPMLPEDMIRANSVGSGTGEQEIKEALSGLSPQELERVMDSYAQKYGVDITFDMIDELGGQDKIDVLRKLRELPADSREAFNQARDEYYRSRSGLDPTLSGVGELADDSVNKFVSEMSRRSARFAELPVSEQQELAENLQKALDIYRESKGKIADTLVDATLAIVAVAGSVITDGVSLSMLAAVGAGSAVFKLAAKAILMGADYDSSMIGLDLVTGFVDGFLSLAGPEVLGLGEKGAVAAAKIVSEQLGTAGKQLIKGGEEAIESAMKTTVRDAIMSGRYEVSEKALEKLVEKLAREGASRGERLAIQKSLKEGLEKAMTMEARKGLTQIAIEYGLPVAAGAVGAGGSGVVRGFAEWDSNKSFAENLAMVGEMAGLAAGFGAGGAAAFTVLFKAGGAMYGRIREHFRVKPGERLSEAQLAEIEQIIKKEAGEQSRVKIVQNADGSIQPMVENAKPRVGESGVRGSRAGDTLRVDGKNVEFLGADGNYVVVRRLDKPPLEGEWTRITPRELDDNFQRLGDGKHYTDGNGNYYQVRENADGSVDILQDWDVEVVESGRIEPVNRSAGLRAGDKVSVNGMKAEFIGDSGDEVILRAIEAPPLDKPGVKVTPEELDAGYKRIGDSEYYTDGKDNYYKLRENPDGTKELVCDADVFPMRRELLDAPEVPRLDERVPEFERSGIPPEQQARIREFAKRSPLNSPEKMDAFLDSVRQRTSQWQDVSNLTARANANERACLRDGDRYLIEVQEPLRQRLLAEGRNVADVDKLLSSTDEVRVLLKDQPEKLTVLDEYVNARAENAAVQSELNAVIEHRAAEMEAVVMKLAEDNGIPLNSIEFRDSRMMDGGLGGYMTGDGQLVINKSLLAAKDPGALLEAVYHEMVHAEQDALVIRALAQEMGITPPPNKEQIANLQKQYAHDMGANLSEEHLSSVLSARKGKESLDINELARAKDIATGVKNNAPPGKKAVVLTDDLRVADGELRKLVNEPSNPLSSQMLIEKLSQDNGTMARHLFKDGVVPDEVKQLLDLHRRMKAGEDVVWPSDANVMLQNKLQDRIAEINIELDNLFKNYLSGRHEQEAWEVGWQARRRAVEKGISNPNATRSELGLPALPDVDRPPDTVRAGDASREAPGRTDTKQPMQQYSRTGALEQELKSGVDLDEAPEMIEQMRATEEPVISVPMEYLKTVLAEGGLQARPTWTGDRVIVGTLGRSAYTGKGEPRFLVRVINKDIAAHPRATGSDQLFHGVVYFDKQSLRLGQDIEIVLPDGTVIRDPGQLK